MHRIVLATLVLGLSAGLTTPAAAAPVAAAPVAAAPVAAAPVAAAPAPTTTRASVTTAGVQGNDHSVEPAVSGDGNVVAFRSKASNLVSDDTNGTFDIFVRDRRAGTTVRVSVADDGTQANGDNYNPAISADGRFVTWITDATNLVSGDENNASDIVLRDVAGKTTTLVSVATGGAQANRASLNPSVSADGRFVAFESEAINLAEGAIWSNVFLRDRQAGTTTLLSVPLDGAAQFPGSHFPRVSPDGRYVAFESGSSNLIATDTNGVQDVFLRDVKAGTTTLASVPAQGAVADEHSYRPSPSADGRFVAFQSYASNMVPGDTNDDPDVFLRDLKLGTTVRVSVAKGGAENSSPSEAPVMSADGRYIAFASRGDLGAPGNDNFGWADVFVKDRITGAVSIASTGLKGAPTNGQSGQAAISADGRSVAFYSYATNTVNGDTNKVADVFVRR